MEHTTNMNYEDLLEAASQLNASSIQALLEREGWEPLDVWEDIFIYRRPKQERVFNEIVLPKWKDELYAQYMAKTVRRYAEFNNLSVEDSLEKLRRDNEDEILQGRREQATAKNKRLVPQKKRTKLPSFA